jgi:hypothetical protein
MFTSIINFYSDIEMSQRTRLGVKYSADIVHSYIDALRKRRTKLRYLDITSLPIAEIIIKYVATHCRLAQKEYQRNCLIDEYLQNVSDLETLCDKKVRLKKEETLTLQSANLFNNQNESTTTITDNSDETETTSKVQTDNDSDLETQESQYSKILDRYYKKKELSKTKDLQKTTSLPNEPLVFKFDCVLQERATFEELIGALDANQVTSQFKLQIVKLDLLCLGKSNIIKLLNKLDKSVS